MTNFDKFKTVSQLGLSLSYHNSLFTYEDQPLILNSSSICRYSQQISRDDKNQVTKEFQLDNACQLGIEDQTVICSAKHPSEQLLAVFFSGSQQSIEILNYITGQKVFSFPWSGKEISTMQFSADGLILVVTQRLPAIIYIFNFENRQLLLREAISDILPKDTPFVPKYLLADPSTECDFLIEIGLRGFRLKITKVYPEMQQAQDNQFTTDTKLHYIDQLTAATCCAYGSYKSDQFLFIGQTQSIVSVCIKQLKNIDPQQKKDSNIIKKAFPYKFEFNNIATSQQCNNIKLFKDVIDVFPEVVYEHLYDLNICNDIPSNAQQPLYGISSIVVTQLQIIVGLVGGMICKYQFQSRLKTNKNVTQDVYESSEEENQNTDTAKQQLEEDLPTFKLINCLNLNLDRLIQLAISNNSPKSTVEFVLTAKEETQQWSEVRSQIEILQLQTFRSDPNIALFVVYDPTSLQTIIAITELQHKQPYSILHNVNLVQTTFISVFNLLYYSQIPSYKELSEQIVQQLSVINTSSKLNKTNNQIGLLQIKTGQLDKEARNPLFRNHVPNQLNTNSAQSVLFRTQTSSISLNNRFCLTTREGLIYLIELNNYQQCKILSTCKIYDAILAADISPSGSDISISCTDTVRHFVQNGIFLNETSQTIIKMAQIVKYSPSNQFIVVCSNSKLYIVDVVSKNIIYQIDGHNNQISSICFASSKTMNKQRQIQDLSNNYFLTSDVKGMIQLWQRGQDKSVHQFNCKQEVTQICEYKSTKNFPVIAVIVNGIFCIIDLNKSCYLMKAYVNDQYSKPVALRDFCVLDFQRILCTDYLGQLYQAFIPNEFAQQFITAAQEKVYKDESFTALSNSTQLQLLQSKQISKLSSQQKYDKLLQNQHLQQLKQQLSEEQQNDTQFMLQFQLQTVQSEKALNVEINSSKNLLVLNSNQPGSLLSQIYVYESQFSESQQKGQIVQSTQIDINLFNRLIQIKNDLTQKQTEAQLEYEHQTKLLQQQKQTDLEMKEAQQQSKLRQCMDDCTQYGRKAEEEAEALENALNELDQKNSENLQMIEKSFAQKVSESNLRKKQLEEELKQVVETHNLHLQQLEQQFNNQMQELVKQKDLQMLECEKRKQAEEDRKVVNYKKYETIIMTADEDADGQVVEFVNRNQAELDQLKQQIQTHQAESGMIRNKFASIKKQTDQFTSNCQQNDNIIIQLNNQLSQLESQKQETEKEKENRRKIISESEEKIYQRKQDVKEKEKHRFVLDFKIKELRKQIQPREQEIHDLQEQQKEIGLELENYNKAIAQLSNNIENLKNEENQNKQSLNDAKNSKQTNKQKLNQLEHEVAQLVQAHGQMSYDQLKEQCQKLFSYGGKQFIDREKQLADDEKTRHKKFLYDAAKQLSEQLQEGKDDVVQENQRIIEENTELLKEAAVLRREIQKIIHAPVSQNNTESQKVFQMRVTAQEAEIKRLQKRLRELEEMQGQEDY